MRVGGRVARISVEVCDVCHDPDRPVKHWRVAEPAGRLRAYALCTEHAGPLEQVVAGLPAGSSRRRRVASMDEVAAAKKTQPGRRPKRK